MSSMKKAIEQPPAGAPAYIVTFSDMITLLLTFFVLLVSLSDTQDPEKFKQGQASFRQRLANFGLPGWLFSRNSGPVFYRPKARHNIEQQTDQPEGRIIDSHRELLRRTMMELAKTMTISSSHINVKAGNFTVTDIRFRKDSPELDEPAKQFLTSYCTRLRETFGTGPVTIHVTATAADQSNIKRRSMISALRAQAVAQFIRANMAEGTNLTIRSWGSPSSGSAGGDRNRPPEITIAEFTE